MARWLYRLGRSASAHKWWFISTWALLIALVGTSAGLIGKGFIDDFHIPGSPGQEVLNELSTKMPSASGGLGVVEFNTTGGARFDSATQGRVNRALEKVAKAPGVQSVVNPFDTQEQLDTASAKLESAKAELDAKDAQLQAAQKQIDAQKAQFAAAQGAATPLPAPLEAQLQAAQKQVDEGKAALGQAQDKWQIGQNNQSITRGYRTVSANGQVAYAQIIFDQSTQNLSKETREAVASAANSAAGDGVEVNLSQDIMQEITLFGPSEAIGVAVAVIVLLLMLGTLIAAGLPLVMALAGVAVGVGGTFALTAFVDMGSMTSVLGLMLGLAVGIDYSLFIVNRHRTQLRAGMPLRESIARAIGTAGNAVLFAGITVVIALVGLCVPGIPFLSLIGLSGAFTVAVAVAVALTLTPAMLALIGLRILSKRQRTQLRARSSESGVAGTSSVPGAPALDMDVKTSRHSLASTTTNHPWLVSIVTVVALTLISIPALSLRLALPDGGSEPANSTAYKAYSTVAENFGAGYNAPIVMVVDLPKGTDELGASRTLAAVAEGVREKYDVAATVPGGFSPDFRVGILRVNANSGPSDTATERLVDNMRATLPALGEKTGTTIGITGLPVIQIDVSEKLAQSLPVYLAIVVGLSLVLLLLVFRSLLVPVVATVGFVFTLGSALGAVVAVYGWGWLGGIFQVSHPGPILSFAPLILTGVLFGLAMDYQMFMVSGMREAFVHGKSTKEAVVSGFNNGARVVSAAAIIMISVFAGFIYADLVAVRPLGLGLAFGVLIDAFVVRMTLTPAVMTLLGKSAWWLPRWLEKILPDVDVEGAKLSALGNEGGAAHSEKEGGAVSPGVSQQH